MKKSTLTAIKIYENLALLKTEVKELETALIELRANGPKWEISIREDKRLPVKLLYDQLIEKRKELRDYESKEFVLSTAVSGQPEDYPNW
jgi:hypothetical protein